VYVCVYVCLCVYAHSLYTHTNTDINTQAHKGLCDTQRKYTFYKNASLALNKAYSARPRVCYNLVRQNW